METIETHYNERNAKPPFCWKLLEKLRMKEKPSCSPLRLQLHSAAFLDSIGEEASTVGVLSTLQELKNLSSMTMHRNRLPVNGDYGEPLQKYTVSTEFG
ncbi:hypothetical protein V9T40_008695 [Parthenolecanium corni]|uniref:Uncharacterized protein n=1 Tax=Parthenolecanium corni TaxID=536013 RepID=A0AAN9TLD4_9HEMI